MEFEFGERLDEFDYQILGVKEYWNIREAAFMLSSFEMDLYDYFARSDKQIVHGKIYKKCEMFVTNVLINNDIDIETPHDPEKHRYFPPGTTIIDTFTTTFSQKDFLSYIVKDGELQIDVLKLKSLLRGEKASVEEAQRGSKKEDLRGDAKRSKQSEAANKQWEPNQQLKAKAKDYAWRAVTEGCICNHVQLGTFIFDAAKDEDGRYLLEHAGEARLSERGVTEAIKELFLDRGIRRIKGEAGVKDAKDCPVHCQKVEQHLDSSS